MLANETQRSPLKQMRSPVKASLSARKACSLNPHPARKFDHLDAAGLLDGAENWDWSDMESDFLTPKKRCKDIEVCLCLSFHNDDF